MAETLRFVMITDCVETDGGRWLSTLRCGHGVITAIKPESIQMHCPTCALLIVAMENLNSAYPD